jgi:hypothetical protein
LRLRIKRRATWPKRLLGVRCKPQAFAHLTFRGDILVLEINLAVEDTNLERPVARTSGRFEDAVVVESEDCTDTAAGRYR